MGPPNDELKFSIIDKEMLASEMRKLNLENSGLQLENKLLKDKYNRASARVAELERSLQQALEEISEVHQKMDQESGKALLTARLEMEREIEQHRTRSSSASKQVDLLKSEITYLDGQLASVRRELETARQALDRSHIISIHQKEMTVYKEEIENLKQLLVDADNSLEEEIAKNLELTNQIHRLTKENHVFRLQMEGDGKEPSAFEKQMASLTTRLQVTEERLQQERDDRAGNLSQIEEKLLLDNAKLQTKNKDFDRQLSREKEKTRVLEQRLKEFREENLQLRLSAPDEDERNYDLPYNRQKRQENRRPGNDITHMLQELANESGLSQDDHNDLIMYLWQDRLTLQQHLRSWTLCIDQWRNDQLDHIDLDNGLKSLQTALNISRESESRMLRTEEKFEDINAEKITSEQIYKQQLSELVRDKHSTQSRLDTLQDLMDALRAENDVLRQGLAMTSGQKDVKPQVNQLKEDVLTGEITSLESKISQLTRKNKVLESELTTVRHQLTLRDSELKETIAELKLTRGDPPSQLADVQVKENFVQALNEELAGLKEEVRCLTDHYATTLNEKQKLEAELKEVRGQLRSSQSESRQKVLVKSQVEVDAKSNEEEFEKKTLQVLQLTTKLSEVEETLSRAMSEHDHQNQVHQDIISQMDELRAQLDQRCQVLDQLNLRENDQLEQLEMVRNMLQTLTQGLTSKEGEVEILKLKLQQAQEKIAYLEDCVKPDVVTSGSHATSGSHVTNSRLSDLAKENVRIAEVQELKSQLLQAVSTANVAQQECTEVGQEVNQLRSEMAILAAGNLQLTNEKTLLERSLKMLGEEKNILKTELDIGQQSLSRVENSLKDVVAKFSVQSELDSTRHLSEDSLDSLDQKALLNKLHTLQLTELAKDKEMEILVEKIRRQEQEKSNLSKRFEILHQEIDQCHLDINRITKELVLKMKENAASVEINKMLQKDHMKMQKKLTTLETKVAEKSEMVEKQKAEVAEVIKQMETCEGAQMTTLLTVQEKEKVIGDCEKQIKQLTTDVTQLQKLRDELQSGIDHLTEEVTSLKNVISVLEHKVGERDAMIHELKLKCHRQKEDNLSLSHSLDLAKQEQDVLLGNSSSDKKVLEMLKEEIKAHEENEKKLSDKLAQLTGEMEVERSHLVVARESVKQTKAEKEIFMKDYQDVCRRLGEKELNHKERESKLESELIQLRGECQRQREMMQDMRVTSEREALQLRHEIESWQNKMETKNEEITKLMVRLQEMDELQRLNRELQISIQENDLRSGQSTALVDSLRKEVMTLREENSQLQDTVARKVVNILDLQDQLRSSSEVKETQAIDMKHTIEGMRAHHEFERKNWKDSLSKAEENVKLTSEEVARWTEKCDQLTELVKSKEQMAAELSMKLKDSIASQEILQEKMATMKESMEEIKHKKVVLESSVTNVQSESSTLKERIRTLTNQMKDKDSAISICQRSVKLSEEKMEFLQSEVSRLQRLLDNQKQQSSVQLQQLKNQAETESKDQVKVQQQVHVLSLELEQVKETLSVKNRENLKLQETVLELEQKLRESEIKVRLGEDVQTKLGYRFEEQENELKKLRNFLSKKADEDGSGKSMWQEMNRVMSELSHQLLFHFETSKSGDHGGREEDDLVYKLRKHLLETECQLNTERALHQITRGSMQALEEDCNRLRQTILSIRKRAVSTEKKQKSRTEEINEIIARSQSRAQALLASGDYSLDTSFRRDFNLADVSFSSDTSLVNEAHLANMSFLNLSSTYPGVSPRK